MTQRKKLWCRWLREKRKQPRFCTHSKMHSRFIPSMMFWYLLSRVNKKITKYTKLLYYFFLFVFLLRLQAFYVIHTDTGRRKLNGVHTPKKKCVISIRCRRVLLIHTFVNCQRCRNPLYVVMIARIFNALPINVKMIEGKEEFICRVKAIVDQHYDKN